MNRNCKIAMSTPLGAIRGRSALDHVAGKGQTTRYAIMIHSMTGTTLTVALSAIAALLLHVSAALAADPAAGQKVFASRCAGCHTTEPGVNKVGPSLAGVFGRKSGSETGFNYSAALRAANINWDAKTLDRFLENPSGDVHGTSMFVSLPSAEDRQNVVAYLETLKP
jgi:cytochrome c